ncbi:UDP-phosphate galactose phosphotransferase [Pasteurellaceae bacterium 15-036681]|nr:UDP-phosphate galactose phosphotransferase [Pasteurellaceae bacterium 15-036681]
MNRISSLILLMLCDIVAIFFSIVLAVFVRQFVNVFFDVPIIDYSYVSFGAVYITQILIWGYLGIYTKRFDFWHESRLIFKGSFLAFVLLFAGLALGQNAEFYSRTTLFLIFLVSSVIVPIGKLFIKKGLFQFGIWQKPAKIISENEEFKHEILENKYLGYVLANDSNHKTIFIDGANIGKEKLNKIIEGNIKDSREIIFTPVLSGYDFSNSYIYNVFNSRTNIFTLENELLKKRNRILKIVTDYTLTIVSSILWLPLLGFIAFLIKKEDPKGAVFFKQKRLGIDGKEFTCYKFRSMYSDQSFMDKWLKDNPSEKEYYDIYHKYMNDPRVTKIGAFLRKTSLDEIPQLINVLKGEMSLVGPRPYMVTEKSDIGQKSSLVLNVKPGITGLWQVSGRSDVDFDTRVDMDVWYMKNWSLWNDIVILLKTIGIVLKRDGAY